MDLLLQSEHGQRKKGGPEGHLGRCDHQFGRFEKFLKAEDHDRFEKYLEAEEAVKEKEDEDEDNAG